LLIPCCSVLFSPFMRMSSSVQSYPYLMSDIKSSSIISWNPSHTLLHLTHSPPHTPFCPQPSLPPALEAMCCLGECLPVLGARPSGTRQPLCSVGGTNSAALFKILIEVTKLDQACVKSRQGERRLLWHALQRLLCRYCYC
jgi:hypothetical protein